MKYVASISLALILAVLALPAQAQSPPCCELGDLNGDGSLSITDIGLLRGYCINNTPLTLEQQFNADVDGDGTPCTTAPGGGWFDAILIANVITGTISTFPRCGDMDWDGELEWADESTGADYDDTQILRQHILNINYITDPVTLSNADASDNGTITTYDMTLFQKLYYGIEDGVPACEF
ncbi:MAG: dockerin type I domain-containing protein [Acidobacteriota bacterium]|nr:dockerin type I domain-containing protein [Acidobacteriota bacterium]